ncbi:MAG: tRNA uridine-5-carboxymethylaminomethyl(34) synthesis enzyme MnmG, partial [Bacteroidales bacterium]
ISPLKQLIEKIPNRTEEIIESAEVLIKYSGYIEREQQVADKLKRLEHIKIPPAFDYDKIFSLSTEARQKLNRIKPVNIGQAARISGVSPSDVSVLLVYMGR